MATQEAEYKVVEKDGCFELRDYATHILAEIMIDAPFEKAGNKAFHPLFEYISGANQLKNVLEMTAPVSQQVVSQQIEMTAPVSQQRKEGKWAISFMMPSSYTLQTLPAPTNNAIELRQVPARRIAAITYSGFWSEKNYHHHKTKLESWVTQHAWRVTGEPVWARYNSPFTLLFFRRNEVLIPVDVDVL
ncbi:MAG: hypothetical protein RL755_1496 [Pseudomonadota bacterium]|jgi:hypothetical protein